MKILIAFLATATTLFAQVPLNFIETFEAPGGTPSADGIISAYTSGSYTFDNAGWEITSNAASGVLYVTDPSSTQINTGSRALALGGDSSSSGNAYQISISGFLGQTTVSLNYGHYSSGDQSQGVRVSVLDGVTSSILYTADHFTDGAVTAATFTLPSADSVLFRAEQIGDTVASDSGIDDIQITAVPEVSYFSAVLGFASVFCLFSRSRSRT